MSEQSENGAETAPMPEKIENAENGQNEANEQVTNIVHLLKELYGFLTPKRINGKQYVRHA